MDKSTRGLFQDADGTWGVDILLGGKRLKRNIGTKEQAIEALALFRGEKKFVRRPPGRPRQHLEGTGDGNPVLRIRMEPELLSRVMDAGGSTWARKVLVKALSELGAIDREDLEQIQATLSDGVGASDGF